MKKILLLLTACISFAGNLQAQSKAFPVDPNTGAAKQDLVLPSGRKITFQSGSTLEILTGTTLTAPDNFFPWAKINKTGSSLADLTTRSASDLSSGTLPDGRFPATLPAASGVNLTALNASSISSGTLNESRLPTGINANKIANGTVSSTQFQYLSGATSNIQAQINKKMGDCISALDYGVSTGASDNSTALQNALNAAAAATHKTLFIPAGTYHFATTLNVAKDVIIWGEGVGDINGYTPSPLYPWGTRLYYDGTSHAINIPLSISPEFHVLEIKATNASTTPGTVGAGIFASNIDPTALTSYLSDPPTPGWPYQTGQGLILDRVYIHEFDINVQTSFLSAQYWNNCNFSSARTTNVVVNYGAYAGNSDVFMVNCFVGGGSCHSGTGFSTKNARLQIHNLWLYDVVHAGLFEASIINFFGLNVETITGDYVFKTIDASILNFHGGSLAPGTNFSGRTYPVTDLTGGAGTGKCNYFGVNGTQGDVKTGFNSVVNCIPAISNQYETLYNGVTLYATYPLGIKGQMINHGQVLPDSVKTPVGSVNNVAYALGADNTGMHGTSGVIYFAITGTNLVQINSGGAIGVPSVFSWKSGSTAAANTVQFGFVGDTQAGMGHPAAGSTSLIGGATGDVFTVDVNRGTMAKSLRLKEYTVSGLSALTPQRGDTACVTDATAPTYLGTLTGGGSVACPVFYNGSAWVSH